MSKPKQKSRPTTAKDRVLTPPSANANKPPVDKVQAAAELIKADQQRRELEAAKEYEEFLVNWTKKHNIKVGFSQPQLIIQAL